MTRRRYQSNMPGFGTILLTVLLLGGPGGLRPAGDHAPLSTAWRTAPTAGG